MLFKACACAVWRGQALASTATHTALLQTFNVRIAQPRFAQDLSAVLAQTRGRFLHGQTRCARKADRYTDLAHMALAGVIHVLQHAHRPQMRVLQQTLDIVHGHARDVGLIEQRVRKAEARERAQAAGLAARTPRLGR